MCSSDLFKKSIEAGQDQFMMDLRSRLLTSFAVVKGRAIIDGQGAMILASEISIPERDPQMRATELRALWGWD